MTVRSCSLQNYSDFNESARSLASPPRREPVSDGGGPVELGPSRPAEPAALQPAPGRIPSRWTIPGSRRGVRRVAWHRPSGDDSRPPRRERMETIDHEARPEMAQAVVNP